MTLSFESTLQTQSLMLAMLPLLPFFTQSRSHPVMSCPLFSIPGIFFLSIPFTTVTHATHAHWEPCLHCSPLGPLTWVQSTNLSMSPLTQTYMGSSSSSLQDPGPPGAGFHLLLRCTSYYFCSCFAPSTLDCLLEATGTVRLMSV